MNVDERSSFSLFVYPFIFESNRFDSIRAALKSASWDRGEKSHTVWSSQSFPKDDLLSHVANYLNPADPDAEPTASFYSMNQDALDSMNTGLGAKAEWLMTVGKSEIPFKIKSLSLVLFRVGVGFLTIRANPQSSDPAVWFDYLHNFRFTQGQRSVGIKAKRRTGVDPETKQPIMQSFYPEVAGGLAAMKKESGMLGDLITACLRSAAQDESTSSWWREVFVPGQLIPFFCLYFDKAEDQEIPIVLYKLRNFFSSRQESFPSDGDLRPDHPRLLPYAKNEWFVTTLEGGGFTAFDAPSTDFFRNQMPHHVSEQYYLLFLLALQQRFALMMLSEEVSHHWIVPRSEEMTKDQLRIEDEKREKAFEHIRNLLLLFTARGLFTQVMQREHHHRCYEQWQQTFQIPTLYEEVRDEVKEMFEYVEMRRAEWQQALQELEAERSKHLANIISFIGILFGIPSLILSFLGVSIQGLTVPDAITLPAMLKILGTGILVSTAIIALLIRRMSKRT